MVPVVHTLAGVAGLSLVTVLAACAGDDPQEDEDFALPTGSPTPQASPTPSFTVEEAAAAEEILEVYDQYRELLIEYQAAPDGTLEQAQPLREIMTNYIAGLAGNDVLILYHTDVAREGRPTWDAAVTEVRLDEEPPTATLRDCLDARNWGYVDRDTGEPLERESLDFPVRPYPEVQLLEFDVVYVEQIDQWRLDNRTREGDQC